jgi:type I restriction enzyme R subunit
MNIAAGPGNAVRALPLKNGFADYLLCADCKVAEGHTLTGAEARTGKYSDGLSKSLPHFCLPLPFAFESTGTITRFINALEPDARSGEVSTFHRPEELIRLVALDHQSRGLLPQTQPLNTQRLWRAQVGVRTLAAPLATKWPRSLIQMATGSGYMAVSFSYPFIKFGRVRGILFLVDRNNWGSRRSTSFSPYTNRKLSEEYTVQRLKRNCIDPASKVLHYGHTARRPCRL